MVTDATAGRGGAPVSCDRLEAFFDDGAKVMTLALFPKALAGDPRSAEVLLKIRRDYRELNDLDLVRARGDKAA